jgi:methionyl-tRNA formyltransferase
VVFSLLGGWRGKAPIQHVLLFEMYILCAAQMRFVMCEKLHIALLKNGKYGN